MSSPQVECLELDQLTCWRIRCAGSELLLAQQGAQILSYAQDGQPPLIWLSPEAAYQRGQSVRGGVPICWPWFGDLRRNPQAVQAHYHHDQPPAHGLVRARDWELLGINEEADAVTLRFAYDTREAPLPGWPRDVGLTFIVRLGEDLSMSLETHNRSDTLLALSQALHSYFAVSDIRQVHVEGLQGCRYIDTLQDWRELQQDGPATFSSEVDRIYLGTPERLSIVDPLWKRRIHLDARVRTRPCCGTPGSTRPDACRNSPMTPGRACCASRRRTCSKTCCSYNPTNGTAWNYAFTAQRSMPETCSPSPAALT